MKCRACGNDANLLVDLGMQPLANAYVVDESREDTYPLRIQHCPHCDLAQLTHFVSPGEIFTQDYAYRASYTPYDKHWKDYARTVSDRFSPEMVLEVGSNDGYLLKHFNCERLGVDPCGHSEDFETMKCFFGPEVAETWLCEKADVLIGNNVLAHTPDIQGFLYGAKLALKADGVAVFEFPMLRNLLRWASYDTIYHEHYSYLSVKAVRHIAEQMGLRMFDVEEYPVHGGSARVFLDKGVRDISNAVGDTCRWEEAFSTEDFARRVRELKMGALEKIFDRTRRGIRVVAFGAAAKATTKLNYCGIGREFIEFIVDENPQKVGKMMPGVHIPIVSMEQLKKERPQCVVILPWNVADEIKDKLSFVKEWGGEFCEL